MAGSGGMTEASLTQLVYDLLAIESAAREAQINQEALYRQQGDESNQQLINLETQQRITAVSAVQTATSQSITRMDGNISQLQTLVNQVVLNVNTFQAMVMAQEANIDMLTGDETTVGSVAKALFDAKAYTDLKISELIDSAPAILDTLKELSDALGGDGNFVTTINNAIAAETSARQAQVLALQTSIAALGGSIGSELETAINDIELAISAEASIRAAADAQTLTNANTYSDTNKQQILNLLSQTLVKKQQIVLTSVHITQGYIELPHINIIDKSLSAFVDRLGIFEDEDFTLLEVGSITRLVFINNLALGGNEALEGGETLRITYWTL